MKSQKIRETFLSFFANKGHKVVPSSSLLPKGDPTILFTNAGMNQFKNVFLGLEKRAYKRAVSVQKCMRVSGKHNDLETVGRTAKHHTFFEMLGNFSFGDYFKKEAVAYAWQLVTEEFGLPEKQLFATVYHKDDAAFDIWKATGVPAQRIFRFGEKDNFWAMGETGPCGPCSEIHYDLGERVEPGDPRDLIEKGSDRFVELWNLVFMEFNRDENGALSPLPAPSIDTGMGLERMAAILQGKPSNYETDLFLPTIEAVCELGKREYPSGDEGDISVRIIADHVRAASFLIGDGVAPGNEGRGYVLRRLIRRAYRNGNLLGIDRPFLFELTGTVADIMKDSYPELLTSAEHISRLCLAEEERFANTLASGLRYFDQFVKETLAKGLARIPAEKAFKLYDTFGFPLDLTQELAAEKKLGVDAEGFARELEEQRQRARKAWKGEAKQRTLQAYEAIAGLKVEARFHDRIETLETKVLAVVKGGETNQSLGEGEEGDVVLEATPFYAEAGGQVGDTGLLKGRGLSARVENTFFATPDVVAHRLKVLSGSLAAGDTVEATPDAGRRRDISGNHTATHLLHAALRQVLGDHVKQAGSLVAPGRLRFDFTHFAALAKDEVRKVESLVNRKIRENIPVEKTVTTLDEGIRQGAMAIFEEKYGEKVRLIRIGDFSRELCGGVHIEATGEIGLFNILSETGIAAGMRRIEAVTGEEALRIFEETNDLLAAVEESLGASRRDVLAKVERLKEAAEKSEKEMKTLRKKLAGGDIPKGEAEIRTVKGIPLLARRVDGLAAGELRDMADALKQKMGSGVVILGSSEGEKAFLVVSVSRDLTARIRADELVREIAPLLGGGGGGRADFAQAGGSRPGELEGVLVRSAEILEKLAR